MSEPDAVAVWFANLIRSEDEPPVENAYFVGGALVVEVDELPSDVRTKRNTSPT